MVKNGAVAGLPRANEIEENCIPRVSRNEIHFDIRGLRYNSSVTQINRNT